MNQHRQLDLDTTNTIREVVQQMAQRVMVIYVYYSSHCALQNSPVLRYAVDMNETTVCLLAGDLVELSYARDGHDDGPNNCCAGCHGQEQVLQGWADSGVSGGHDGHQGGSGHGS